MTAVAPAPLEVRDARRRFGDRQALAGVSLAARPGQILVLLGPNGAGKTTLLRAVAGATALDSGTITVGGAPAGSAPARSRTGLVPQNIALFGRLSVRTNLELFARLAGQPPGQVGAAVDRALDWTGLGDRARDRVSGLSGGMQRRVNLAAGTLHGPGLLLLDEPTVGLDPAARTGIHGALRELGRQGMALLMTTHDLQEAEDLADRVAFLSEGRLVADGPVADLVGQTFGGGQEVNVLLKVPPDHRGIQSLTGAGLTPTGQARWWMGVIHEADAGSGLKDLLAQLDRAGLATTEVRVRQPGLHGVFLRLTGQAPLHPPASPATAAGATG